MARLTIEQVKAPDFSSVSEMLARANQSFTSGMESAKGILDSYNEGQQAKGDQALIGALAGLNSEEDLANFLRTTDLASMNISDTMRQNILGARSAILGNNQTRQATTNAADANARANAGETRTAAEYLDGVARRNEQRALTPAFMSAVQEAQRYGTGSGSAPAWLVMDNQGATRNDPLSSDLVSAMSFLGDMGITMKVVSGGQENNGPNGTGSTRHNHGNAADADFYIGDRKLDWNNPQDLPIFQEIVTRARANGITGIGADNDYMGAGRMHIGFGESAVWGAGGSGDTAPEWLRAAYNGAVAGTVPVRENPMGGQATADFTSALMAGTYMTPDEALALYNNVLDQQRQGQKQIDAAEARRQAELAAQATTAALLDPNNLSEAAVQRDLLSTPGLSYGNQLAAAGQDLGRFGGVIAPTVSPDQQVTDALARSAAADQRQAGIDPTAQLYEQAQTLQESGNVGQSLLSGMEVPEGSGVDAEYVNRRVAQMAQSAGVTEGEMAATLAQVSQGNFGQFNDMLQAAPDTDMYATIMSLAERNFGEQARAAYDASLSETSAREAERAAAELQLATARTRAAKLPVGSSERAAAEAEINTLRDTILKGMTPREREQNLRDYISRTGMASRLQGLDPNSAEFYRAMAQLEETVRLDSTLTPNEKELLLADIRG